MSWRPIARREFAALTDGRSVRVGAAFVAFVFVAGGYIAGGSTQATMATYAAQLSGLTPLVVTVFALLFGYRAIVADRAAGRLTLVLSLPHSRRDVLAGKFAARGIVILGSILVGVLVGAWLVAYPFGTVDGGTLAVYLGATLLFALALFAIALALSTLTASPRRATVGAFAVIVAVLFWRNLRGVFARGLEALGLATPAGGLPDWALFVYGVEPSLVYGRVVDSFVVGRETGVFLGPDAPWYLGGKVAVLLLLAWFVGPLVGGYLRFRGTDL
ncbi:MAG: ABC transporter permease subunit [Halobacteriales archaeon]|nr:ABC transporter permease subunit [Halobacteriales archaeon]